MANYTDCPHGVPYVMRCLKCTPTLPPAEQRHATPIAEPPVSDKEWVETYASRLTDIKAGKTTTPFTPGALPGSPVTVKPSNPKDALGILKIPGSTVPAPVVAELSVAMLEGALKYGRHNYRSIGVRASVYYDAALRHLMAWWEGEDNDPDSELSHIIKAIASLVVLRDGMMTGKWVDDRPPRSLPGWQTVLNTRVKALLEKYPDPVKPYTEKPI